MELERFKSAWQQQPAGGHFTPSPARISRSLQFLRTSSIRDLQRFEELSRLVFSLLFALLAVAVSLKVMGPGSGRIAAWLFAAALLADCAGSVALLARRFREPATASMVDFIKREHRQVETRLRIELYSKWLMLVLAAAALLLALFGPKPANLRDNAFDALWRTAVVTAFLAVAWRRAKSRSKELHREQGRYLKDLEN